MSCGVNIPLASVVEAIIDSYGDVLAGEVLKKVNLTSATINDGTLTNTTLRGSLTLDDTTKTALCGALQDCIAKKVQDELKCDRDNHVTEFFIDDTHLTLKLKFGETFRIAKQELKDFIGAVTSTPTNAGGITGGTLGADKIITVTNKDGTTAKIDISTLNTGGVASGTLANKKLTLTNKDTTTATVDLSSLDSGGIRSGRLSNNKLILTNKDGSTAEVDLSSLNTGTVDTNTYPTSGEVIGGTKVRIHLNDNSHIDIDASSLKSAGSPYIVSGEMTKRNQGYWLDFTRNDQTKVSVDMTAVMNGIISDLRNQIMGAGYLLNTQNANYKTVIGDFTGHTIIRANANTNQTITLTKPDDTFIGKALIIRKTNGAVGTAVTLQTEGVTITPADVSPLRRVGSAVTLVYTGSGNWDAFGELP